jgi:hypothetical protein
LVEGGESATIRALMPQLCATKFFSIIANYLFSMTLPERASGLLCEVIRQEVEQAIQPLLAQLTKLTVNSVSNGIPPVAAAQVPAKLPPERVAVLARQAKNLHTQGLSWAGIAKQWNAQSIPTVTGIGQWHGATVARLLRNE